MLVCPVSIIPALEFDVAHAGALTVALVAHDDLAQRSNGGGEKFLSNGRKSGELSCVACIELVRMAEEVDAHLDLGLGHIEWKVANDDLAARVATGTTAGDDNRWPVAVTAGGGRNNRSVLCYTTQSGTFSAARACTRTTTSTCASTSVASPASLGVGGDKVIEGLVKVQRL